MTRLLVDLTEFKDWNGHLTGVQRVVDGIASNLDPGGQIIFYSYDDRTNKLVRDDIANYASHPNDDVVAVQGMATTAGRDRIVALASKLYFTIPLAVRRRVGVKQKHWIKLVGKRVIQGVGTLKKIVPKQASVLEKPVGRHTEVVVQDGDILLIAGRLWDHKNYQTHLANLKSNTSYKLAVVVYDLIPVYQQHTFGEGLTEPYAEYLFNILSYADWLLPISKSSERDLKKFAKESGFIDIPKVQTIRLGDDIDRSAAATKPTWVNLGEPFSICVGTVEARKNHALIYYAYKLAVQRDLKLPHLYIVGKPGWLTNDIIYSIQHDADINGKITIKSDVRDGELAWLYTNALYTVYPSQYEGWGLPIAESLLYGVPCIASATSSMQEIAPDLVEYISPFSSDELMHKMHLLTDQDYNKHQRNAIARNYRPTKWSDTTKEIKKLISR